MTANILAACPLPFGDVQLVEWHWPSPMDVTVREDRHMIEMSLPPLATDGSACFPDLFPDRFRFMGSLFLRPAGITLRARSAGGRIQVVRVAMEPEAYATIVGTDVDRRESALRAGLDLRDESPRFLMRRLRDELECPGLAGPVLAEAYATALAVETARCIAAGIGRGADTGRLAGWQYRRITDRIESGEAPPTLAELATLCGVSVRHFCRLYRALTGENVTDYITRVQTLRASRLLKTRDLPLKEISARLGFTHPGSFSTAFRRATGMTPGRYRKENT